ncbi:MAG: hypothetical protein II877_03780, partial [Synergistaceae bacterium]|nr:hypothetical protein [Synergistaceae bacterium]
MKADNVLLPELYRRKKKPDKKNSRGGKGFMKFLLTLLIMITVSATLFSFADIGGNIALNIAKNFLSKNFSIALNAESITGNPIKGYTLRNFSLTNQKESSDIFSAGFLSVRVSLPALLTGNLRLAEISLGGISMDVDEFTAAVRNLEMPSQPREVSSSFMAGPAFADDGDNLPELPLERFRITDSRFSSGLGVLEVREINADIARLEADIDGALNGLPLSGNINMDSLTDINRSELLLGTGKIIATGGIGGGRLDLHLSAENFSLKEAAALYPSALRAEDFDGNADLTAAISGTTDNPRVTGSARCTGPELFGYPVERASANFAYSRRRITVSNIQASVLNIPVQGEIAAAFRPGESAAVMVKLDGSEASLDGLDEILGIPGLSRLKGRVSVFSVNISGHVDELSGLVSFTSPRITYSGRAFTDIRAQMKLAQSDTAKVDGKFAFEGASGYISGNVAGFLTDPVIDLTAKIADLDIKRIESMIPDAPQYKPSGKITASVTVKGSPSSLDVTGSVNSPEFSAMGHTITHPAVEFSFTGKTLTLTRTEGTLSGIPVSITGTISPVPSEAPRLNINATVTMTPEAVRAYLPAIGSSDITGTVNAGIKISGDSDNPSVSLLATSPSLRVMDMISAEGLELTTALDGDLSALDKISVNITAKSIKAMGLSFTGASAGLSRDGDKITLEGFSARSGEGMITGVGTASLSGDLPLDFSFMFTDLALESLAEASSSLDTEGKLSGTLKISGDSKDPEISLTAFVPVMKAAGVELRGLAAEISGKMSGLVLKKLRAKAGAGDISVSGNFRLMPSLKYSLALFGSRIDTADLMRNYPAMSGKISGNAGLMFSVSGDVKDSYGEGSFTAREITAFGLNLTDVNMPLSYSGGVFSSAGGKARLYGGTVSNTFTLSADTMSFTDDIEAASFDVNGIIQGISGGMEGRISGTGRLVFHAEGSAKDGLSYRGWGDFSAENGELAGLKWLRVFTGTDSLRYSSVNAPLMLQTGRLIIKADAAVNALPDESVYKYLKLTQDGTVTFGGKDTMIDFMTESSVNFQLLGSAWERAKGGIEALMKGSAPGFQENVRAFLFGISAGAGKAS